MRKILLSILAVLTLTALNAQEPWFPTIEIVTIPQHEADKTWQEDSLSMTTEYPFLNLLAESAVSLDVLAKRGYVRTWRIGADITTFFRDAEFSTQLTRGYTALGYFVTPHVSYLLQEDVNLTLGAELTGIAGEDGFWKARPLVRLEYAPTAHWLLVMGTLYGGNNHRLYEPMWCIENTFLDHSEQGFEIFNTHRWDHVQLKGDTWLNWQNFLEPWEAEQEVFTAGSSQRFSLDILDRMLVLNIPMSFLGQHHGGQFTALDTCVTSLFNESLGLSIDMSLSDHYQGDTKGRWVTIDLPIFYYQNASPGNGREVTPFAQGQGFFPQLTYQHFFDKREGSRLSDIRLHHFTAQIGYWRGSQWIAPVGSYHFQSVSWHKKNYLDPSRSMATARLAYELYHGRMTFGTDVEVYHDLVHSQTDCAFGIYMRTKL